MIQVSKAEDFYQGRDAVLPGKEKSINVSEKLNALTQ